MSYKYKQIEKTVDNYKYEVTVDYSLFEKEKEHAYEEVAKDLKIPGFRVGKAPRAKVEQEAGSKIISHSINHLAQDVIYEIVIKEKLNPVTTPMFNLVDIDKDKGFVFTFEFTNYPEIKLGDFKKIKVKKEKAEVSEEEIDTVIKNIIRSSVSKETIEKVSKIIESKSKKSKKDDEKEDGQFDFEINDALIAELKYDKEKDLASMRVTVKEKLEEMKQQQLDDNYADSLIAEAVKVSEIALPKVFIERELENMELSFNERLKNLNLNADQYLKTQGTSLEERRKEWEVEAKKRIESDLILISIAAEHKNLPQDSDVDEEISKIEDKQTRERYESLQGRDYIRTILTRQRGLNKLIEIVEK